MTLAIGGFSLAIGLLLGLLGGGGSILTVPMLVYLAQLEPKAAIATSLLVVGVTSSVAVLSHARRGNVCWRAGTAFGTASMAGAYAGGRLAAWIPSALLMQLFAGVMLMTAVAMLIKRGDARNESGATCPRSPWILSSIAVQGILVGLLTGLVGAGGGFLVVPALALLGRLPMRTAIGTSLMIVALNSYAGLAGYLSHEAMDWAFAAGLAGLTVTGSLAGSRLAPRIRAPLLRRGFGLFVMAVAFYLLYKELDLPVAARLIAIHAEFWLGVFTVASLMLLYRLSGWLRERAEVSPDHNKKTPGNIRNP